MEVQTVHTLWIILLIVHNSLKHSQHSWLCVACTCIQVNCIAVASCKEGGKGAGEGAGQAVRLWAWSVSAFEVDIMQFD